MNPVESPDPADPTTPVDSPAGPSLLDRIRCLVSSPPQAFVPPRDTLFWLGPLLIVIAASLISGSLLFDLQTEQQMRFFLESDVFQDEALEVMIDGLSDTEFGLTAMGTTALSVALVTFVFGLFALLGVNFIVGGTARYLDLVGVIAMASLATVARDLITLPIKLSQQNLNIHTGPAALVSPDHKTLYTILKLFDVFDIYHFVLLAIGFAVVGSITLRKGAILALLAWMFYATLRMIWSLGPLAGLTGG